MSWLYTTQYFIKAADSTPAWRVTINILDKIKLNDGCVQELH